MLEQFGLDDLSKPGELDRLLRELPAVRPIVAEILTRIAYQTEYGIYDHSRPDPMRPLALHAVHSKENIHEGGTYYTSVREFFNYGVGNRTGLSLAEYFELPFYITRLLIDMMRSDIEFSKTPFVSNKDAKDLGL